ncbi:MAG: hypothetical protein DMF66_03125 [Acidobacteria bacterium]|nr:MAG: hypothetical protein DMF66_03125 [Acidobacteriota bacterium]
MLATLAHATRSTRPTTNSASSLLRLTTFDISLQRPSRSVMTRTRTSLFRSSGYACCKRAATAVNSAEACSRVAPTLSRPISWSQ